MYNDLTTQTTPRAHGAYEITLQVRETEKKLALLHARTHAELKTSGENVLQRTARRIVSVMAGLF